MAEPSESETPEFWNVRYGSGDTPWTLPTISKDLESFIARTRSKGSVLIPGCGADHEAIRRFDAAGFDVRAIDFSPVAVQQAQAAVGFLRNRIILGGKIMLIVSRNCFVLKESSLASSFTEMNLTRLHMD
jgi:hypothetical protein